MDFEAEATIVTELMKFAESGQLYRGAKPVMWSPVEKTALAEAEIEYEDIISTQIDVAFEIVSSPIPELVGAHAVIWTTTPWTIPVNQAIAYGPEVRYGLLEATNVPELAGKKFLIARQLLVEFNNRLDVEYGTTILLNGSGNYLGSELAGTMARHPMAKLFETPLPFRGGAGGGDSPAGAALGESPHPNPSPEGEGLKSVTDAQGDGLNFDPTSPLAEFFLRPRPFLPGDFVTTDTGTGLVHMSPDHGEDDFDLCKANRIEPVFAVTADGKYKDDWAWLGGQGSVINPKFNAPDGPICTALREAGGLLAASADYKHSYPHSWRSKAKVIYRCTPQWFVPMDKDLDSLSDNSHPRHAELVSASTAPNNSSIDEEKWTLNQVQGDGSKRTLRTRALTAIADTRWVPEKGRNRINSMVEGRPDWVLSRQRAWGVPITLFVNRKTGVYLCDPAVNARIIAGIREHGVDAWSDARAQEYLGSNYDAADYERVKDILDVWFDSGCTHAFVLESGRWPDLTRPADHIGPWADLYLEGSDQHRGWFQSSLLESSGTRGYAPYKAVLTHGFTMDQKGMKMSKSLGNTINPLKIMENSGADIIRLWALSVDYTEDHRIGDEILKGVSDQYRKLRNTFRYMLGALDGFSEAERVDVADMPELERYVLHLLADMDAKLRTAVDDYDFNTYVKLLTNFANEDLSAFFFDIRKDCLYCDAVSNPKRMAYRTVLDILFHAMVRYAAPVLVFTAEEIWQSRFGVDAESVHLQEWPEVDAGWVNKELAEKWQLLRAKRTEVTGAIEPMRRDKVVGSSLECSVITELPYTDERHNAEPVDLAELFIVSDVVLGEGLLATKTTNNKCGRCWRHLPEVTGDGALCGRCKDVIGA